MFFYAKKKTKFNLTALYLNIYTFNIGGEAFCS